MGFSNPNLLSLIKMTSAQLTTHKWNGSYKRLMLFVGYHICYVMFRGELSTRVKSGRKVQYRRETLASKNRPKIFRINRSLAWLNPRGLTASMSRIWRIMFHYVECFVQLHQNLTDWIIGHFPAVLLCHSWQSFNSFNDKMTL